MPVAVQPKKPRRKSTIPETQRLIEPKKPKRSPSPDPPRETEKPRKTDPEMQKLMDKVDETRDVLEKNVVLVMERHGKIEDLEGRAKILEREGLLFQQRATKMETILHRLNNRWRVIVACIGLVVVAVVVLVVLKFMGILQAKPPTKQQ